MTNNSSDYEQRRKPGQERSRQTLQTIHQAALKLIECNGLENVSMTSIAGAAGLTKAALYRYFSNKGALIYSIAKDMVAENRRLIEANILSGRLSSKEGLSSSIREYCDMFAAEPYRFQILAAVLTYPEVSKLEIEESRNLALFFTTYVCGVNPKADKEAIYREALLSIEMMGSLARLVVNSPKSEGDKLIEAYTERFSGYFAYLPR